ncbi:hypothetical protein [Streptomyces sp. Tu102]|uniref:NACHT N-terminal Helical domain 1-containing protein n=1 Tax=Streptomyces sp. Tu102 TaxID=2838019 RepID=UPI0035A87E70
MDPTVIGTKIASGLVGPLVKRLFVQAGPGAGLVDKPVRLAALVSFRGEKRKLGDKELRRLVRELVTAMSPCPETSARPRSGAGSTGRSSGVWNYAADPSPTWASSGRIRTFADSISRAVRRSRR